MSYPITYNGIEGQTNIYARIRRKLDGKYWGGGNGWVADSAMLLIIVLNESLTVPGQYEGSADFVPSNGGIYIVSVYTQAGILLAESELLYRSRQQTILELIREVQSWLRLPQAGNIAESHAQLLLGFANEVQSDYMADYCQWEEMRLQGAFETVPGISVYSLSPNQGGSLDSIIEMRIGTSEPLTKPSFDIFRKKVRLESASAQPTCYNHYGRAGSALIIEMYPTPDATYRVTCDMLLKPAKMSAADDTPLLDQDTIMLGMKYLARKDQGEDFTAELQTFQAKLLLRAGTHGESEDMELDFL